jgi:hypothetical protein
MVNRTCKFCKEEKDESICLKGQNVCYDCNNRRRREQRLKKLAEQTNNPKTCNVCKEVKTEKDFPVNSLQCKKCAKKIFVTNARKKTEDMKKQGITKKTCIKCEEERDIDKYREGENVCNVCKNEMGKAWIDNNQEHFKELCKKYRQKEGYQEKRNEYKRNKYKDDPNEKLSLTYRKYLREFINKNISKKREEKLGEIYGCSKSKFKEWIEYCFTKKMTWDNYGEIWNFDHIKPCSSFKLENDEELKECFNWKNTAPVYCKENYRKYNNRDLISEENYKLKVKLFEDKLRKEKATKKLKNGRSIKQDLKDTKENIKVKSKDKAKTKKVSKDIEIEDIVNISDDEESCEKKTKKSKGKNIIKKNKN